MLKTYNRKSAGAHSITWAESSLRGNEARPFAPGDSVTTIAGTGVGMIVAISDEEVSVLWSTSPEMPDAGFVDTPYIPVLKEPVVFDASDFMPRKGIMTRPSYAEKPVQTDFYSTIKLLDLPENDEKS